MTLLFSNSILLRGVSTSSLMNNTLDYDYLLGKKYVDAYLTDNLHILTKHISPHEYN